MSPEILSQKYLSIRSWLFQTVLPAALALVFVLFLLAAIDPDEKTLDHTAVLVGFSALYFILFRGGHMIMIRSLHTEMMRQYEDAYRDRLRRFEDGQIKRRNLGFTLARIKRDILMEARDPNNRRRR